MFEYKVVPAPARARKVKGLKTVSARFAHTLAESINAESAGGWKFERTETLTCETRSTLGKTRMSTETVMVFSRPVQSAAQGAAAATSDATQAYAVEAYEEVEPHYAEPHQDDAWAQAQEAQDYHAQPQTAAYADPAYQEPQQEAHPRDLHTAGERAQPLFRAGAGLRAETGHLNDPRTRPLGGQTRGE